MNEAVLDHRVSRAPKMDQELNLQTDQNTSRTSFLDLPGEIRNKIYDLVYKKVGNVTVIDAPQKLNPPIEIRCRSDGCWLTATLDWECAYAYHREIKATFDLGLLLANEQVYEETSDVLYGSHTWEISLGSIWQYGSRRMGSFGRTAFFSRAPLMSGACHNWEQRNTTWDHTVAFPDEGLRKMRRCKIVVFLDRNRASSSWQCAAAEFGTVRNWISSLCNILSKGHTLEYLDVCLVHSELQTFNHGSQIIDERVLESFPRLRGINSARVHGNVTAPWANWLQSQMMSENGIELRSPQPLPEIEARMNYRLKRKVTACRDAQKVEQRQYKEMKYLHEPVEPAVEDITKFLVQFDNWREVFSRTTGTQRMQTEPSRSTRRVSRRRNAYF